MLRRKACALWSASTGHLLERAVHSSNRMRARAKVCLVLLWVLQSASSLAGCGPGATRPVVHGERQEELANAPQSNAARAQRLIELFKRAGLSDIRNQPIEGHDGRYNVIATLPGDVAETIVVGAHVDFVARGSGLIGLVAQGQGVIDNWSGATLVASLANALHASSRHRTFVFVGFDIEEWGLVGSRYYVSQLSPEERGRILGMVNLECLGVSSLKIFQNGSANALIALATRISAQTSIPVQPMILRNTPADSTAFMTAGIPAITFHSLEPQDFKLLHSYSDRYDAINPDRFEQQYHYLLAYLLALDAHEGRMSPDVTGG